MKKVLKWAGYGAAGLVGVAVLAIGGGLAASEVVYRWPVAKPAVQIAAAHDPGAVGRGERLATVMGCNDCHGADLQGRMFDDVPNLATLYAPNLTRAVARQSDADLDRAIRHGVRSDGRPLWIMPSASFADLEDGEIGDLIAYLRSKRAAGPEQPDIRLGPIARVGIVLGRFKPEVARIQARTREHRRLADLGPRYAAGRELARACVECHGFSLEGGNTVLKTPDLTIAASYDREDFETLLRTGVAAGNRKAGLMSDIAPGRFGVWSSAEIGQLHDYLKARAAREVAAAETLGVAKR